MVSLGSLLLDAHLATLRQVEDATFRQMLHGDDLSTHLLDLGLTEAALLRGLAQAHGVEPLEPGELPKASPEALERVPLVVAERYRLYPLSLRDGALEVVVAEPWPEAIREELSAKLGLPLRFRFASLPRIRQALARDYEAPLPVHLARLLEVLDASRLLKKPVEKASMPAKATRAAEPREEEAPPSPRRPRRLGPITPALAKEALEDATNRDEVLSTYFDFARQFFECSALFVVQRTTAEAFAVDGSEGTPGLSIPLDSEGKLSEAKARKLPMASPLSDEGEEGKLREGLGRTTKSSALLVPVVVRDRTVALLYGDRGEDPVELATAGEVIALAPLCGQALERIILRRKLGRA